MLKDNPKRNPGAGDVKLPTKIGQTVSVRAHGEKLNIKRVGGGPGGRGSYFMRIEGQHAGAKSG